MVISLEGEHLGARHKHLNQIINNTFKNNVPFVEIENIEEHCDSVRLYKINLASKYKNVDYIMENITSNDILYASEAINKSKWLITDPNYGHIINPTFLNEELFPKMLLKAAGKLNLKVRLLLKDAPRVEQIFEFYKSKGDLNTALKWINNCSPSFKCDILNQHFKDIDILILKRICHSDPNLFKTLASSEMDKNSLLKTFKFMLFVDPALYLDLLEKQPYLHFKLGRKGTDFILKNYHQRAIQNLTKYEQIMDFKNIAKKMTVSEIKEYITKSSEKFDRNKCITLVKYLPQDQQFPFVKQIFIDKEHASTKTQQYQEVAMACSTANKLSVNTQDLYVWYQFAPFEVAFKDLKQLIQTESNHNERINMISVLIKLVGNKPTYIHTLLEYFLKRHINEPTNFKEAFANRLISHTKTHKYNDVCWKLLTELFHNLEVFKTDFNGLNSCRNAIVIYNILHNIDIQDYLIADLKNGEFSWLIYLKQNLDTEEGLILFNFLIREIQEQCKSSPFTSDNFKREQQITEEEFTKSYSQLNNYISIIEAWKKDFNDYPEVTNILKNIIKWKHDSKSEKTITISNKQLKRQFFEDLLIITEKQNEILLYILKHNAQLLKKYENIINLDNQISKKFLSSVRVYFSDDLAKEFLDNYLNKLKEVVVAEKGHQEVAQAICLLMDKKRFEETVKEYTPENFKIKWSEEPLGLLNVRKYFAQNMGHVRPLLDLKTIEPFTHGDYLQWAVCSLQSLCANTKAAVFKEWIPTLLKGPISLKKLTLRFISTKFDTNDFVEIFGQLWKDLKHPSIRAVLFASLHRKLKREDKIDSDNSMWILLKKFLSEVTVDEDRTIYPLLADYKGLPNSIKCEYFVTGYNILKNLPEKLQCQNIIQGAISNSVDLINEVDDNFYYQIIGNHFHDFFVDNKIKEGRMQHNKFVRIIAAFLVQCSNKETIETRFKNIVPKLFEHFQSLIVNKEKRPMIENYCLSLIDVIISMSHENKKNKKFINGIYLLESYQEHLSKIWEPYEIYPIFANIEFSIAYWKAFEDTRNNEEKLNEVFCANILELLPKHKSLCFDEVDYIFRSSAVHYLESYWRDSLYAFAKHFSQDASNVNGVLLAIDLLPNYCYLQSQNKIYEEVKNNISNIKDNKHIRLKYLSKFEYSDFV